MVVVRPLLSSANDSKAMKEQITENGFMRQELEQQYKILQTDTSIPEYIMLHTSVIVSPILTELLPPISLRILDNIAL